MGSKTEESKKPWRPIDKQPNCLQTSHTFQPTRSRLLSLCRHSPTVKKLALIVMEEPCQSLTAINQSWGCRAIMCSQGANIETVTKRYAWQSNPRYF